MALVNSFEKSGNLLFKYRGQIPVVLFLLAIPVVYLTQLDWMNECVQATFNYIAIAVSLFGFLFRAYAIGTTPKGTSGRNTKQQVAEVLNQTGIYSIVRHPLYVGNYFMWIGIVLFTYNIYFVIIVSLLFWIYYERIMFAEERFLEGKFGDDYMNWSNGVPAFIPAFNKFVKSSIPFSLKTVLRREYAGILATVLGFVFVDYLRAFFSGLLENSWIRPSFYVLIAALVYALIFRSLKHYTRLLHDANRS